MLMLYITTITKLILNIKAEFFLTQKMIPTMAIITKQYLTDKYLKFLNTNLKTHMGRKKIKKRMALTLLVMIKKRMKRKKRTALILLEMRKKRLTIKKRTALILLKTIKKSLTRNNMNENLE